MPLAQSKVTAQGQISVPAEIRRLLGVGPGAVLQWNEENGKIVVSRVGQYTSKEINKALFPNGTTKKSIEELKAGIGRNIKERHARR